MGEACAKRALREYVVSLRELGVDLGGVLGKYAKLIDNDYVSVVDRNGGIWKRDLAKGTVILEFSRRQCKPRVVISHEFACKLLGELRAAFEGWVIFWRDRDRDELVSKCSRRFFSYASVKILFCGYIRFSSYHSVPGSIIRKVNSEKIVIFDAGGLSAEFDRVLKSLRSDEMLSVAVSVKKFYSISPTEERLFSAACRPDLFNVFPVDLAARQAKWEYFQTIKRGLARRLTVRYLMNAASYEGGERRFQEMIAITPDEAPIVRYFRDRGDVAAIGLEQRNRLSQVNDAVASLGLVIWKLS